MEGMTMFFVYISLRQRISILSSFQITKHKDKKRSSVSRHPYVFEQLEKEWLEDKPHSENNLVVL